MFDVPSMSFSNFSKLCESFLATSFYYYLMCKFSVVFMGNSWHKILYHDAKSQSDVKWQVVLRTFQGEHNDDQFKVVTWVVNGKEIMCPVAVVYLHLTLMIVSIGIFFQSLTIAIAGAMTLYSLCLCLHGCLV